MSETKRRNTPIKQEILLLLSKAQGALCQEDIERQLAGKANRVTIYRVLNMFCEDGVVHRVVSDEGISYFALCKGCTTGNHHDDHVHFHCRMCDTVECLPSVVVTPLPRGYRAEHSNCWVTGVCRRCRRASRTAGA